MATEFTLPKWYDLHTHFRQGEVMKAYIAAHKAMGCAGAMAMPNTKPPVAVVFEEGEAASGYWSIERYMRDLCEAGGEDFDHLIVPLYLTQHTTPEMIAMGSENGVLRACKAYPPHGTTGAEFGVPITDHIDNGVFKAMEEAGVVLCVHGEEQGLPATAYFDRRTNAEEVFYKERMGRVRDAFPNLKIVCEHITTKVAVEFVKESGDAVAASVTPQHLIYTIGDLIQGLKYHLFCLPVVKFEEDRAALRAAVTAADNTQFFAGTDSAPHTKKATECGCAAGCFTGGVAPQLYAHGFELAGVDMASEAGQEAFKAFLCYNGARFYGLELSSDTFTLIKKPSDVEALYTPDGSVIPLPLGINEPELAWSVKL
jgi:dihydroorotase